MIPKMHIQASANMAETRSLRKWGDKSVVLQLGCWQCTWEGATGATEIAHSEQKENAYGFRQKLRIDHHERHLHLLLLFVASKIHSPVRHPVPHPSLQWKFQHHQLRWEIQTRWVHSFLIDPSHIHPSSLEHLFAWKDWRNQLHKYCTEKA